jgi:hypothetical protein
LQRYRAQGRSWDAAEDVPRRANVAPMSEDLGMHIYLETERVRLRRITVDDVDNLVQLDGDPEVMRYLGGGAPLRATS